MPYPRNPYSTPTVAQSASTSKRSVSNSSSNEKSQFDPSSHPGLINLGNTCFLNSVLQAFASTQQFKLLLQASSVELQQQQQQQQQQKQQDSTSIEPLPLSSSESNHRYRSPALRICDQEHGLTTYSSTQPLPPSQSLPVNPSNPDDTPPSNHQSSSHIDEPLYEPNVLDLPLNTALRHLLEKFWTNRHSIVRAPNVNPKGFLTLLGAKYDQYLEYNQQDGHELMCHLLDACRMEELDVIKKMRPSYPIKKRTRATDTTPSHASISITDPPSPAQQQDLMPFLDMLFCGKLASMVICEGCKKVSHTYEDFYDLSLSLRNEPTVGRLRKRDRIRNMAERWRRATHMMPSDKAKTNGNTKPLSETETSDGDAASKAKKGGFLSPEEGKAGLFLLRRRSTKSKDNRRAEKMGATSGSEMEPDFPDMASMSLTPTTRHLAVESAPTSAGEDNGDVRTSTRIARMLNGAAASGAQSSREVSPHPPLQRSTLATSRPDIPANGSPPVAKNPHQAAYIAKILADDPTAAPLKKPAAPSLVDLVSAAATALPGKPLHGMQGLLRVNGAGIKNEPSNQLETDPNSVGAKRRRKFQEQQASTGLIASLRQFTSVDVLDGDNSFACKNCWRLANPLSIQEREKYRRHRARHGMPTGSEEGSDSNSSEGESDTEDEHRTDMPRQIKVATSDKTDSIASRRRPTTEQDKHQQQQQSSSPSTLQMPIPTIQMTSVETPPATLESECKQIVSSNGQAKLTAPKTDSHGRPRVNTGGSDSSVNSFEDASSRYGGYETGTETDLSGNMTGFESESETEDNEAAGATSPLSRIKSKRPKRSVQSLPRRALKRYLIASAPPVLIFHLKRFQATGRGFVSGLSSFKKIDDEVTFPEYLDISPWLAPPREEYDRKGRLKATSDPLVLRKRAEEGSYRVQVEPKDHRQKHWIHYHHRRNDDNDQDHPSKRHLMWSWPAKEPTNHTTQNGGSHPTTEVRMAEGLENGAQVKQDDKVILSSVIPRPKTEYRLYAVVVHQGSLSAGHYTAYVLSDRVKTEQPQLGLTPIISRSAPPSRSSTPAIGTSRETKRKSVETSPSSPFGALTSDKQSQASDLTSVATNGMTGDSTGVLPVSTSINSANDPAAGSGGSTSNLHQTSTGDSSEPSGDTFGEGIRLQSSISSIGSMASSTKSSAADDSQDAAKPFKSSRRATKVTRQAAIPTTTYSDDYDIGSKDDGRRWVYTSDTLVRAATIDEVLKAKAYMLFYERI